MGCVNKAAAEQHVHLTSTGELSSTTAKSFAAHCPSQVQSTLSPSHTLFSKKKIKNYINAKLTSLPKATRLPSSSLQVMKKAAARHTNDRTKALTPRAATDISKVN